VVDGVDRRVCAVTLRLGREAEDDGAGDQPADRHDEWQEERRARKWQATDAALADRLRRRIPGRVAQKELRRELERGKEERCAEPGHDTDDRAEHGPLRQVRLALEAAAVSIGHRGT
jgi:hypothetical protein